MPVDVELLCGSSGEHLSQLYTGYALLRNEGRVAVSLRRLPTYEPGVTGTPYLRAVVNRQVRVVYDLADGASICEPDLQWCTVYFKRSYDANRHQDIKAVQPLGLNYPVYGPGDWRAKRLIWSLTGFRANNARSVASRVVRLSRILSYVLRANGGCASSMVRTFEAEPEICDPPKVLFLTRTWDPARVNGEKAEEWQTINAMRARCIRTLRQEFGDQFTGGLAPSADALRDYPDCIVEQRLTQKQQYSARVKRSDICISTTGLRGSNPWRIAEYVAASRSIVTERLRYKLPGSFVPERNYVSFDTSEGCVEGALRLAGDPELRLQIMQANQEYYRQYVRPDALVWRSIDTALSVAG